MAVTTEFRIVLTATFDNAADRDTVATWLRNQYIAQRDGPGLPAGTKANHLTKDEYAVNDPRDVEDLSTAT